MRRWQKILLTSGLGVLSFLFGFAIVAPMAMGGIEGRVLETLEKKGVDLTYSDRTILMDKVVLDDVEISRGELISCTFDSLAVDVDAIQMVLKSPEVDGLDIEGGDCTLTVPSKRPTSSDVVPDDGSESTTQRIVEALLADPPSVEIDKLHVKVIDGSRNLTIAIEEAHLDGFGSERSFEFEGTAHALEHSIALSGSGALFPKDGKINLTVTERNGGELALSLPDVQASVRQIGIEGTYRPREFTIALEGPKVESTYGSVNAVSIEASYPDVAKGLTISSAKILVPASLVRTVYSKIKNRGTESKSGGDNQTQSGKRTISTVDRLARDLRLNINDSSIEIQRKESVLKLVENLNADYNRGTFDASGLSAGGTFDVRGEWDPVRGVPNQVAVTFIDINLGDIPGMPKERSKLPNRGTSGRLDGIVTGSLLFAAPTFSDPRTTARLEGSLEWREGVIDLDGVSIAPIENVNVSARGAAKVDLFSKTADFNGSLETGKIRLTLDGFFHGLPLDPEIDFTISGGKQPCQDYFHSIPRALWGPYDRATWEGETEPKIRFAYPHMRPIQSKFKIEGYEECVVTALRARKPANVKIPGSPVTKKDVVWLNEPFIRRVIEGVSDDAEIDVGPGTKDYVNLKDLPAHVGAAAYLSEQMEFYLGETVSFPLIQRAFRKNLQEGRFVYGGSTVTQQLVKNLFLTREKTIARKLQEMLISWRIKGAVELDRILELYVNCIEFGPDIYGIGPAAQYYFQKPATELTARESVFLAMLKPGPIFGEAIVKRGKTPSFPWWSDRADVLFERLVEYEVLTKEEAEDERPYSLEWKDGKYVAPIKTPVEVPLLDLEL